VLLNGSHIRLVLQSIRSLDAVQEFSQNFEESDFLFCGGTVAMVSVLRNFTADVTVTQTI
jgi:hypothetical protein